MNGFHFGIKFLHNSVLINEREKIKILRQANPGSLVSLCGEHMLQCQRLTFTEQYKERLMQREGGRTAKTIEKARETRTRVID